MLHPCHDATIHPPSYAALAASRQVHHRAAALQQLPEVRLALQAALRHRDVELRVELNTPVKRNHMQPALPGALRQLPDNSSAAMHVLTTRKESSRNLALPPGADHRRPGTSASNIPMSVAGYMFIPFGPACQPQLACLSTCQLL